MADSSQEAAAAAANPTCVLVTGANVGIGLEAARQLASIPSVTKILLGCRSETKATAAKEQLEGLTDRTNLYEIVIVDVSDLQSVKTAVEKLANDKDVPSIDGLILNAGGAGGSRPKNLTRDGVTNSMAVNVLGHIMLVEELIKANKLSSGSNSSNTAASVIYSGSESARGVPEMDLPTPKLDTGSVEEFTSICNGSFLSEEEAEKIGLQKLSKLLGGYSKLVGTLCMSSMSRKYRNRSIRFLTMSPGATAGTTVTRDLPWYTQVLVRTIVFLLTFVGKSHSVEVGAKRYIDALTKHGEYQSGVFYASRKGLSGDVVDQAELGYDYFANEDYQDNAYEAVKGFL